MYKNRIEDFKLYQKKLNFIKMYIVDIIEIDNDIIERYNSL